MGTRADFYVGRGKTAEWLGSVAWDGYPEGLESPELFAATTEDAFRAALKGFEMRDDWTSPSAGWPWPWDDSNTTDYAYAFDGGTVWGSCFGATWFDASQPEPEEHDDAKQDFPDMSDKKKVTYGPRSGLIVF